MNTAMGTGDQSLAVEQAMGDKGLTIDVSKFQYIGNPAADNNTTAAWHTSGIKTIEDAKRKLDVVAAEIERLESKIAALAEGSVAKRDVSDIARRVDEVAEGMRRTDETMRQLQLHLKHNQLENLYK